MRIKWDNPKTQMVRLVRDISDILFEKEFKRIQQASLDLVKENREAGGEADGFFYQGILYTDLDPKLVSKGKKGNLVFPLYPKAEKLHSDKKQLITDKSRITMAIQLVTVDCLSFQEVRDALPDCVVDHIADLKQFSRIREEAFTLINKPTQYQQYMAIRPRIEFYAMMRFMY